MKIDDVMLPEWELAIFPPDGDDDGAGGGDDKGDKGDKGSGGSDDCSGDDRGGDRGTDRSDRSGDRGSRDGDRKGRRGDDNYQRDRIRGRDGQYESREDYENRIADLEDKNRKNNEENAQRRRENNDLRASLSVMERRTIRSDVRDAVSAANPVSDNMKNRAVDAFLADMGDAISIDKKTGETTGLDKFEDWKKKNAEFFKASDGDADDKGDKGGDAGKGDKGDGKGKDGADGKRGNRTAAGGSQGNGSGGGDSSTDGMPDLATLKTPAERRAAINAYKQSLKRGGGGGYAKASSRAREK